MAPTAGKVIGCQGFGPRNLNLSFILCTSFFQEDEKRLINSVTDIYDKFLPKGHHDLGGILLWIQPSGWAGDSILWKSGLGGEGGACAAGEAEEIAERTMEPVATWALIGFRGA